ncbi:MAG: hypothetical protein U9Q83_07920 [Bacteroidota bacterium]|nr:hypothetical protein [Bacteroidota bacterium]
MAKKSFKSGLDDLFKDNINDANESDDKKKEKVVSLSGISIDDVTDEKLKWLLLKIQRYEKELKLWRTGKLTLNEFNKSLKKFELEYNIENNEIKKID